MKIRLSILIASPFGVHAAGSIADLPEAMARALVADGHAVEVVEPTPAPAPEPEMPVEPKATEPDGAEPEREDEVAIAPDAPETTVLRRGRRRRDR